MDDAVTVDDEGPKLKPELMEPERMYHCIYKDVILLFFVDEQKFLNCYEIAEPALVEKVRSANPENIEAMLQEYCNASKL